MSAGRYKHNADKIGKARIARARPKREAVKAAQRQRRKEQRAKQRELRSQK